MKERPDKGVKKQESLGGRISCLMTLALQKRQIAILIMAIFMPISSNASLTCKGHFVNPITDVCWECLLPISIGTPPTGISIGKGMIPKKRDTKNPKSPLCMCIKGKPPLPIPGLSIGFWEPVRLVDVTRTPYCMVNLGGISIGTSQSFSLCKF